MTEYQYKCNICGELATWKCNGEVARFGVPLDSYYCDKCKPNVKPRPKIMSYNNFPLTWIKLDKEKIK